MAIGKSRLNVNIRKNLENEKNWEIRKCWQLCIMYNMQLN